MAVVAVVLTGVGSAAPAVAQQFVNRVFKDAAGEHKYVVFTPAGYRPGQPTPAILYLHGAGERGTDGIKPTLVGLGPYVRARSSSFPFLVVFPQAEELRGPLLTPWTAGQPDGERALAILDEVQKAYAIDRKRTALVGWSMGGFGAWSLGAAYPERWSAVAAFSGGGDPAKVDGLKTVPVWAFHGAQDSLVFVDRSRQMVDALKAAGGNVTYSELPNVGHELFDQTFGNDGLLAWLENPKSKPAELSKTSRPIAVAPPPFVPVVDVPGAVGIRLGNDALMALSYAAPQLVPPGLLSGRLNDMFDSTTAQGRSFSVRFSGLSYSGALDRVSIKAIGKDRVSVQIGVRAVTINIAGTSISGQRHAAQAGPINIGIGHNQTVWLSMEVQPVLENRKLRLRLLSSSFSIPPESYYVTQPAGVSVQGIGMTQEVVVNGLVNGLYGARGRVENEVRNIAPGILRQLEDKISITDAGPIVAGMWPLPVYQPRLRAYPQAITTDADGISLVMGVEGAAFDLAAKPGTIAKAPDAGVQLSQLTGKQLSVAIAPQVLGPLTQTLIESGLARLDVRDIPAPAFARLADRSTLETIVPDLKRFPAETELRTDLRLAAPLAVGRLANGNGKPGQGGTADPATAATSAPATTTAVSTPAAELAADAREEPPIPLEFQVPNVTVTIETRAPGAAWQAYAEFSLSVRELVAAQLKKPTHDRRSLEMAWQADRAVSGTGRFAPGVTPQDSTIHSEQFVELFRTAWSGWTGTGPAARSAIPDLQFASTRLRLQHLGGPAPILTGTFEIPTIKVSNLSEEVFVYETKGPYSAWSAPYRLEPGKSHEYQIAYPLTYRHAGKSGTEVYTLITGSHSEYRPPVTGGPPRLFQARDPQP